MKTCSNCGKEIEEGRLFCDWCGADLDTVTEVEIKKEKAKKKPSARWIWVLAAVSLFLIGAIAANILIHKQKQKLREMDLAAREEMARQNLASQYDTAVKSFAFYCDNIVVDKKNREGEQLIVIGALKTLQTIERCENDTLFPKLGKRPCFKDNFDLFQSKLVEARDNLYLKNKTELDRGDSNVYLNEVRERLGLIDDILEQSRGGSVAHVQIKRSTTYRNN